MKKSNGTSERYLWHRPETRFVWFRMAVPKAHQARAGKSVVKCSLGTTDRRQASVLAGKLRAELFDQWEALPQKVRPKDSTAVAIEIGFDKMIGRLDEWRSGLPADGGEYAEQMQKRENDLRLLTRRYQDGDMEHWEAMADRMIAKGAITTPATPEAYGKLIRELAEASIDGLGVFIRRNQGDLDAGPRSAVVQLGKAVAASKAKDGETILKLFERWAAECLAKGEKRADTVNQDRKVITQFAAFVGDDRAVGSITAVEVAEYRDALRDLPPKWRNHKQLTGLTMREAAIKARELDLSRTAFTTVNKHLSTISPLYAWLAAQPAWAGLTNPCNGLHHAKVKGKNRRPSFSTDNLNAILKSPVFTGFLAHGKEHLPGNMQADDWRKWIPLIAMLTGARIGEIAQLRVCDVRKDRDVWFIHIRHDEAADLTTKSGKSRPAAVHSILEKIGFLAFHARQVKRANGSADAPLFPELKPNNRGQISGKPSRWWRDYLEGIGVKDGGDGFGAHSFRHTLADRLRSEAELLDDQIEVALGHNQKTTTSGYGELSQGTVTMFKGWMDLVRFDGVDFSHLVTPETA